MSNNRDESRPSHEDDHADDREDGREEDREDDREGGHAYEQPSVRAEEPFSGYLNYLFNRYVT